MNPGKLKWKEKLSRKLFEELSSGMVVVEGEKDEKALKEVGATARILRFSGGLSVFVEKLKACPESALGVLLLLDYDEEGERKARLLQEILSGEGLRVRSAPRALLKRLLGVQVIEEVPAAWRRLLEEVDGRRQGRKTKPQDERANRANEVE